MTSPNGYGEWVPLPEAAQRLAVSVDTLRRRLKKKEFQGRTVQTMRGYRWEIYLENDGHEPSAENVAVADPSALPADRLLHPADPSSPSLGTDSRLEPGELARLIDKLTTQNVQLAGQVGFLQARLQDTEHHLEEAQVEILLLKAPPSPEAEPQEEQKRPWWLFWKRD